MVIRSRVRPRMFVPLLIALWAISDVRPAFAEEVHRFDVSTSEAATAIHEFGVQSGVQILAAGENLRGKRLNTVVGDLSTEEGLRLLLSGTGLTHRYVGDRAVALVRADESGLSSQQRQRRQNSAAPPADPSRTQELPAGAGAVAQQDQPPGEDRAKAKLVPIEEVVVTGTHLRGVTPVGSQVIVIDREAIAASGHGRVQEILDDLPQNFSGESEDSFRDIGAGNFPRGQAVDLRGLGASSTLVLVNGRRQPAGGSYGSFVDISSIATSAVERVEVLTDGASALYGSDAIGGVVNFILRKDYDGFETDVRVGTKEGNAEELRVSQLVGQSWTGGNFLIGYQYSDRDALMRADTPYASRNGDFRALGGSDYRSPGGNPGTILDPDTFQPAFAIPAGQDGSNLTADQLIPGQANSQDNVTRIAALPEEKQHNAFFTVSQNLNDRLEVFAEGRYSKRKMEYPAFDPTDFFFVPPTNPFYVDAFGTGGDVLVMYSFGEDFGELAAEIGETQTYTLAAGGVVRLGKQWELNLDLSYGREKTEWDRGPGLNYDGSIDAALADPNSATALNLFGDGSNNNPATIAVARASDVFRARSRTGSLRAIADGPVFQLPAGMARLALGADYRDERAEGDFVTRVLATGVLIPCDCLTLGSLDRQVAAVFGELALPILGDEDGALGSPRLEVTLASRYEDYSDFGSTLNPKIGFNFVPVRGVQLRGTWGTSFRAPRFHELSSTINAPSSLAYFAIQDPKSPTGLSDALVLLGANPDLQEETADIWTAGFTLTPVRLSGLSLAATYFSVDYEDKIQLGGEIRDTLLFEDEWAEIITRNPTTEQIQTICNRPDFNGSCPAAPAAILDLRLRNLAGLEVRGVDLDVRYQRNLRAGDLSVGVAGTRMLTYERTVSSTSPHFDVLDTVGQPLALHLRGWASWGFNGWHVNASVNYADDYRDPARSGRVGSWTTINSSVSYEFDDGGWTDGTRVRLSAVNLLDEEPPFVDTFNGFDVANASQSGRSISLDITKRW